jgi:hypothetical protein
MIISVGEMTTSPATPGFAIETRLLGSLRFRIVSFPTVTSIGMAAKETDERIKTIMTVDKNNNLLYFITPPSI